MITARDVTADRITHNGAWFLSALVDGYFERCTYYGTSKREAIRDFVATTNAKREAWRA